MGQIKPTYPVVLGDANQWGPILNTLLKSLVDQGNAADAVVSALVETIQDTVAAMFIGRGITFDYDDSTGKILTTVNLSTPAPALTNVTPPAISGTTTTGYTLTTTVGDWNPTPERYAYQWRRDGAAIDGATGSSYVLTTADVGCKITALVMVGKAGYTDTFAVTAAVTAQAGTPPTTSYLLTEDGKTLTTETGDRLVLA